MYIVIGLNKKELKFSSFIISKNNCDESSQERRKLYDYKTGKLSNYFHRITNKETVNTLFVVKGKDYFSNPFDEIKIQKELTRQNLMKVISDLIKEKVVKNSTIAVSKKNFTVVQLTTKNLTSEETAKIFPSVVKDLTNLRFGKIYYLIGKQVFINEELFIKGYLNQTDTDKVKILNKIKRKNIIRAVGLEKLKSVFLIKHHQSEFEEFIKRLREE